MEHLATGSVARQLGTLFAVGSAAGLSDRQLLDRFNAQGDPAGEAAFATLVSRHGPMVLNVCRQLLGDRHLAEDAFQAVFLVLARKAHSIRDPDLLGNWLYGVALRTARCARRQIGGIGTMARPGGSGPSEPTVPPAEQVVAAREQAEALHVEIERLPEAFRLPVVLCYLEGLTVHEAARQLRWSHGTVRSRMARAREKLRRGLIRRGIALSATALTAALAPPSASAFVSPLLFDSTTRAAMSFAARHAASGTLAASTAALAQEVLRAMLLHNLKVATITLMALASVATAAGWLAFAPAMTEEPVKDPATPIAQPAPRDADRSQPQTTLDPTAPARMTVAGRVLDPEGKPLQGAVVDLVARPRSPWVGASEEIDRFTLLGQGQSDGDGRYRLDAPRTASTRVFEVYAMAAAPGYGVGWAALNPDAEQPTGEIKLQPEQVVRARLVDVTGAPAKNVEVRVLGFWQLTDKGTGNGISLGTNPPEGIRTWPRPAMTNDQGRVAWPGLGRGVTVALQVRDMRYARQDLYIDAAKSESARETTIALEPARLIEGRVLAADTGRPIPNAVVSASTHVRNEHANGFFTAKFRADDQGRFLMNPIAGESYTLGAFPTGGEPYLIQQDDLKWTKGAVKAAHDIKVPRGVLLRGKVTEQGTGRPRPASSIQFIPVRGPGGERVLSGWQAIVASQADGTFQIAVPAGKGHLLVFGPTGDYVLREIGFNQLYADRPGGQRYRAHAIIPYEVKAGDPPHEVAAALRPGVTIQGRVEGPDGQTVTEAFLLSTLRIEPFNPSWRGDYQVPVRDGRFELHGLDPDGSTRIYVLDPENDWGATVEVSGKQAGEGLAVRLQPCGQARARFVGPDGKPVAKLRPNFEFVATPGPYRLSRDEHEQAELAADTEHMANVDRKHYWNGPHTDDHGRIILVSLIPGALYRIIDFSTVNDQLKGAQIRKDFTVKPGETLDLGEILIEKPEGP